MADADRASDYPGRSAAPLGRDPGDDDDDDDDDRPRYARVPWDAAPTIERLGELHDDGWELVSVVKDSMCVWFTYHVRRSKP